MTRKTLTYLLLTFSFFGKINAQERFGVFGGITYSAFSEGFIEEVYGGTNVGLQIGALYELPLNKKIAFRPKIVFSQQGDRTPDSNRFYPYFEKNDIDYKLNYLNFPLDIKFWNKIYVIAGPQIGFLISKEYGKIYVGEPKGTDIGLNLGTGFTLNKLFFELGLYQGLSDVNTYQSNVTKSEVNTRNTVAKFSLGYKF